jgi:hypothetical protein
MRAALFGLLLGCNGILAIEKASLDPGDTGVVADTATATDTPAAGGDAMEKCANPWVLGKMCTAATECTAPEDCVRGRCIDTTWAYWPMATTHSYSVYPDIVVDNNTCLMWQRETDDAGRSWSEAIRYCRDLTLGGYDDWRLPTRIELTSLQEPDRGPPAIDTKAFPDVPSCGAFCREGNWFWCSKSMNTMEAQTVRFDGNGGFGPQGKGNFLRVRCVR